MFHGGADEDMEGWGLTPGHGESTEESRRRRTRRRTLHPPMAMMRQLAHIDNNLEDDDVVLRLPIQGNCFAGTGN